MEQILSSILIGFGILAGNFHPEEIDFYYNNSCRVSVTHEQLKAEKEIQIDFPEGCDSLRVYFPPGGTVTSASLFKDSLQTKNVASSPGFGIMEDADGYVTLSEADKGRLYLVYGSCHWGSRMWIDLR